MLMIKSAALLLVLMLIAVPCTYTQDGWISLFNGKDLTGWKASENPASFTVQNGAIVANGPRSHCFYMGDCTNNSFRDFELVAEVMTLPKANGGIYFHTAYQEQGWPEKGFEVQVNNSANDPIRTGSLYHVQDIKEYYAKDNEWFTERIVVRGNTVGVWVNDKQVVNWTQPEDWKGSSDFANRRIGAGGMIALQGHDPGSTVRYRNIRIRRL
jgi:hypothetical protein